MFHIYPDFCCDLIITVILTIRDTINLKVLILEILEKPKKLS